MVHPSFQVHSVAELIAYAKANPGKVNYGLGRIGTVSHVCGEYFATAAGVKLITHSLQGHWPGDHRSARRAHSDDVRADPGRARQCLGRKLRALAVTSLKRSTPAAGGADHRRGGPARLRGVLRYGLVAPAGTPRAIIERLNKELNAALATDEVRRGSRSKAASRCRAAEEYAADIDREEASGRRW